MYKLSDFNHYIRYNDRVLYFNTRTLSSFLLAADEHRKMKENLADPITFEFSFPSIFQQFREWGFFVEEGIDELGEIRLKNILKISSKNHSHILINLSDGEQNKVEKLDVCAISSKLKTHLMSRVADQDLKELSLEWYSNNDKHFRKLVYPLTLFIKEECERRGINFSSQLDLKVVKIENINMQDFKDMSVNAISMNYFLLDSNSYQQEERIKPRLLNRFFVNLAETIAVNPMLHFNVNIYVKKDQNRKKIKEFIDSIEPCVRDNISVTQLSVLNDGAIRTEYPLILTKLAQKEQWRVMDECIMKNYSIDYKGFVYFGRYVAPDKSRCIGQINENGEIVYDSVKRGFYYGMTWFDNQQCRRCKFLPLFLDICSRKVSYYGNARHIACPIKDKSFNTDQIMVNIFESKQNL